MKAKYLTIPLPGRNGINQDRAKTRKEISWNNIFNKTIIVASNAFKDSMRTYHEDLPYEATVCRQRKQQEQDTSVL